MTRSSWKHGYVDAHLFNSTIELKTISRIWSRRSIILPDFIGRTLYIHRGNGFVPIKIVAAMVGHKFGEFAFTRRNLK